MSLVWTNARCLLPYQQSLLSWFSPNREKRCIFLSLGHFGVIPGNWGRMDALFGSEIFSTASHRIFWYTRANHTLRRVMTRPRLLFLPIVTFLSLRSAKAKWGGLSLNRKNAAFRKLNWMVGAWWWLVTWSVLEEFLFAAISAHFGPN